MHIYSDLQFNGHLLIGLMEDEHCFWRVSGWARGKSQRFRLFNGPRNKMGDGGSCAMILKGVIRELF